MNSHFLYIRSLQATEVLGRTAGTDWLASNLIKGHHSVVWDHPKTGKSSLINKALMQIKKGGQDPIVGRLSCFNVRSENALYAALTNKLFHQVANTLGEWEELARALLPVSRPEINVPRFQGEELTLIFEDLTKEATIELAHFPQALATHLNKPVILVLESFQTLVQTRGSVCSDLCHNLSKLWKSMDKVTFLLSGRGSTQSSGHSIYRELFDYGKPFYKFAEHIPLERIEEKEFTDYIIRNFAKAGRVISKDFAEMIYRKMEGHPYYVQCFSDLCFSNTKGYMNQAMFERATEELLEIFRHPFENICRDLSLIQIHFLRALADKEEQLCSQEVLQKYSLISSANVYRARDALEKKAIIETVRKKPVFIDPLFKLWFTESFIKTYWIP
ncbi:MAG: ATP-binding protein [Bacteroidales bacterium]|nr:ATP-binding protein [Bacteroidales bacterium]